jgi:hypothetical protein
MREFIIAIIFILLCHTSKAQGRQFLGDWFFDLPLPNKPHDLHTYEARNPDFKVIWTRGDSSSRFLVRPNKHFGNDLIAVRDIDSAIVDIEISFRPEGASDDEHGYSGPTVVVTVEYFLKSGMMIDSVMDLLIRKLLLSKYRSADVAPGNGSAPYRSGEFLYADNKRRYRLIEIYENVYSTRHTSLLISFEFERRSFPNNPSCVYCAKQAIWHNRGFSTYTDRQ